MQKQQFGCQKLCFKWRELQSAGLGLQEIERFATAYFADDKPIWPEA